MKNEAATRPRGRPRQFDRTGALVRAMHLFWRHGYEATSVHNLTEVMGITPPSLYSAFGDKKQLFFEAIDYYQAGPGDFAGRALREEPTAEGAIRRLLLDAVTSYCNASRPPGCMVVLAATNCASGSDDVQANLAARRRAGERAIRERIAAGQVAGELPHNTDIDALAGLVASTMYGLSLKARDGATPTELWPIVDQVMAAWPPMSTDA
jgi:TetR/AcrR family transcriptional regulator, copper-responsive repressor